MSDERMARPVSGEIMTDGQRKAGGRTPAGDNPDIIDADFETIVPGRQAAAREAAEQAAAGTATDGGGMDMLRVSREGGRSSGGPLFWIVGLALVFGAFWVSGGHALVSRGEQQAAAPTAIKQPLRIMNVVSRIDRRGDRSFLLVDGEVANPSDAKALLPPLAIIVTDAAGRQTSYYLGTNDKVLTPGERFAFSSRLHAPKEGVKTVTVDFGRESDG